MLRVTVELLPGGSESRARKLGEILIRNDGTGTTTIGNYEGTLTAEYTQGRRARVCGFRRQRQSVWTLVGAFLKAWGHVN